MALTRDLERQGHVTLQVTYFISGPVHARYMIFFISEVCWVRQFNSMSARYVALTRDLVR